MPFKDYLKNNSDMLISVGAGLLSGGNTNEQLGNAFTNFANERNYGRMKNKTLEYLQQNNPDLAQMLDAGAIDAPTAVKLAWEQRNRSEKPMVINGKIVDPTNYNVLADFSTPAAAPETWDTVSPEDAKQMGLPAGLYQRSSKTGKLSSVGGSGTQAQNAPSGYVWNDPADPSKGVSAIPGGPAEKLPSEVAGRLGLADEFQKNLPSIQEHVKAGDVTGPVDVLSGQYGRNQTYRQIQTGVDALQRMLTGAGMSISEAQQYANRYLPTMYDSPETLGTKIQQLSDELNAVQGRVMAGHGQQQAPQQAPAVVDYGTYFQK